MNVLFQMWGPFRESLIKTHLFYIEQARKRLLSQFDNIDTDADRAADEWLKRSAQYFDPDRDDPRGFYETANDVAIEFYGLLSNIREQTRLSVVAGMFHEWDKQLRSWLVHEIHYWHQGDKATSEVWKVDFGKIVDLLESLSWNVRNTDYFCMLDTCRLVVNAYKHGKGNALDDLRDHFPEYLDDSFKGSSGTWTDTKYRDHTHLKVSDDQFRAFSEAILAFWRDVPENVDESQVTNVPGWFNNAILKDDAELQQTSKK